MSGLAQALDWTGIRDELDREGYAVTPELLSSEERRDLQALYDDHEQFRSTVDMARYNYGQGQYRYLRYPLPPLVQGLRESFYPQLAAIANEWAARFEQPTRWPETLAEFTDLCRAAGQARPTPLLLRYPEDGYNCLHQDLYGDVYFPLQMVVLLSRPGIDFEGGELLLVEQRPRLQSRAMVVPLPVGAAAIIPVRERPRQGRVRFHRAPMRHGVSRIRRGNRMTLGIIFHDAA